MIKPTETYGRLRNSSIAGRIGMAAMNSLSRHDRARSESPS